MNTYKTAEVAAMVGVHPNTVRLYEDLALIPKPERQANGYRVFTDFHIAQFRLARLAFQVEVLQNGLRKKIVQAVKIAATGDFDAAILLTRAYLEQIEKERRNAAEAVKLTEGILSGKAEENICFLKRKEVSEYLDISMDTLRNWEMNGLLAIKRKKNGYRIYSGDDIRRLKIIRSLRCANYSLEAILQMLCQLSENPNTDITAALDTPRADTDIIAVCDQLVTSLLSAKKNGEKMIAMLREMKIRFS